MLRKIDRINLNSLFGVITKLVEISKTFLLVIISGKLLSQNEFGIFSFMLTIFSIVSIIAEYRLQDIIFRNINRGESVEEVISNSLIISILFSGIGYVIFTFVGSFDFSGNIQHEYYLFGIVFFLNSSRVLKVALIVKKHSILVFFIEIFGLFLAIIYLFGVYNAGTLVLSSLVKYRLLDSFIVAIIVSLLFLTKYKVSLHEVTRDKIKHYLVSSLPLVFSGFAVVLYQKLDSLIIKFYLGFEVLGLYTANFTLVSIFTLIPVIICQMYSSEIHLKANNEIVLLNYLKKMNLIGASFSVLYLLLSNHLIAFLFNSEFVLEYPFYMLFSSIPLISTIGASGTQAMISTNCHSYVWIKSLSSLVVNLILNIIFINIWGLIGCLVASIISMSLSNFFFNYVITRYKYIFILQTRSFNYASKK